MASSCSTGALPFSRPGVRQTGETETQLENALPTRFVFQRRPLPRAVLRMTIETTTRPFSFARRNVPSPITVSILSVRPRTRARKSKTTACASVASYELQSLETAWLRTDLGFERPLMMKYRAIRTIRVLELWNMVESVELERYRRTARAWLCAICDASSPLPRNPSRGRRSRRTSAR
jgi:hypothetical protein